MAKGGNSPTGRVHRSRIKSNLHGILAKFLIYYGVNQQASHGAIKYILPLENTEPASPVANFSRHAYQLFSKLHDKYFPTIGTLLPMPKALLLTRMIGQNWFRLYSFVLTSLSTLFTNASSIPRQMISFGPWRFSIY